MRWLCDRGLRAAHLDIIPLFYGQPQGVHSKRAIWQRTQCVPGRR